MTEQQERRSPPPAPLKATIVVDDNEDAHFERARILERMSALEVAMEANTELTRQIATTARKAVEEAGKVAERAAAEIKEKADASYAMTMEIRDLLRAGRAGLAVLKYLGLIATPLVAIATAWHYFMGQK